MVDRATLSLERLISITSLPQNVSQGKILSYLFASFQQCCWSCKSVEDVGSAYTGRVSFWLGLTQSVSPVMRSWVCIFLVETGKRCAGSSRCVIICSWKNKGSSSSVKMLIKVYVLCCIRHCCRTKAQVTGICLKIFMSWLLEPYIYWVHLLGKVRLAENLDQLYWNVFIPCGCVWGVLTGNKWGLLELLVACAHGAVAYVAAGMQLPPSVWQKWVVCHSLLCLSLCSLTVMSHHWPEPMCLQHATAKCMK